MSDIELIHGDCMEWLEDNYDCHETVALILTDPPYDLSKDFQEHIHRMFMKISNMAIVFSPPENQWILPADQILFWLKPISTKNTSKSYSRFVEMLFIYGRNEWNAKRHWSQYTNVFQDLVDGKLHPYQKPESLIRRLILNHTNPNDLVLDPYMGSGTTGVVCKQLGRRFIGIEKEDKHFQVAKNRIEGDVEEYNAEKHLEELRDNLGFQDNKRVRKYMQGR